MIIEKKEDLLKCIRNELVPKNPEVKHTGVKGLLEYRLNDNFSHPDSIYEGYDKINRKYYGESNTADYFRMIYNIDPFKIGSSDTIFNCWSFLNRFLRGVTKKEWVNEEYALNNLGELFANYDSIKNKLDQLANYHHSLANFMPAPFRFNGCKFYDGKGNINRDNDMPDLYYKRAELDFHEMYEWINDKMDSFSLRFFKEYNSFLTDGNANKPVEISNKIEMINFENSVTDAIKCIETRAKELFGKMKS